MGCNMCVVHKPEDQYRVMFQVSGQDVSKLSQEQTLDALHCGRVLRRGHRRKAGVIGVNGMSLLADCVESGTQTDISFQHLVTVGRNLHLPSPSPPLPPIPQPYLLSQLSPLEHVYYDPTDYFDISQHEVDRQEDLEYEEVELFKSQQQEKLGLTVCYRTDEEEDLGIYVGEVDPNSIAAKDGRIREGDRILQINGVEVQDGVEAVAILTREDSTNISLLLARPEREDEVDELDLELEVLDRAEQQLAAQGCSGRGMLLHRVQHHLSASQELDSGVGRTDESTRNDESSEHDLLADDATSTCTSNATNTPGSMRRFQSAPPCQDITFSTDSLLGPEGAGTGARLGEQGGASDTVAMGTNSVLIPGLTEEELERYRELLEIRCLYERNGNPLLLLDGRTQGAGVGVAIAEEVPLDMNCNESLLKHELLLLEEELRHLEFKWRNVLRAQKMQQLRERCLKVRPPEMTDRAEGGATVSGLHRELSDINETPERERSDKESTSAYNTGGESCRSTPLAGERYPSPSAGGDSSASATLRPHATRHRTRISGDEEVNAPPYPDVGRNRQDDGKSASPVTRIRSLSRNESGSGRRGSDGARRSQRPSRAPSGGGAEGGKSADSSPYLSRRRCASPLPPCYQSCLQLQDETLADERDVQDIQDHAVPGLGLLCMNRDSTAPPGASLASPALTQPLLPALSTTFPHMEWKVKIRSDGSRYVTKRPVRDRLLKARALKISEERSGMTTDDDAVSEMKMGRYWSKEERKQQLLRAREHRRRREIMLQSRLDVLRERERDQDSGGQPHASILELSQRKSMKKRSRRILDNWITIQELLAHGTRSADGRKVFNPLLSVTTV